MLYDPVELQSSLAAAVGDDAALIAELQSAFIESAQAHLEILAAARSDTDWIMSALRLQGLAASFGASPLMRLADDAAAATRGDAAILKRIGEELDQLRAG
jgi:HPt (histidine-containing phosphotransfer) domain-containing protein